ncbi:MAG: VOC family protein [Alphaproteobacteria bacterium]
MSEDTNEVRFGRMAPGIAVNDIHKAHDFYARIFGFKKVFENGNPVGFMILRKDVAELHLSQQKGFKPNKAPGFNVAHLMVSDAAALYDTCARSGVHIIKSLKDKDYGLRAFVFEDLDGTRIDVGESLAGKREGET